MVYSDLSRSHKYDTVFYISDMYSTSDMACHNQRLFDILQSQSSKWGPMSSWFRHVNNTSIHSGYCSWTSRSGCSAWKDDMNVLVTWDVDTWCLRETRFSRSSTLLLVHLFIVILCIGERRQCAYCIFVWWCCDLNWCADFWGVSWWWRAISKTFTRCQLCCGAERGSLVALAACLELKPSFRGDLLTSLIEILLKCFECLQEKLTIDGKTFSRENILEHIPFDHRAEWHSIDQTPRWKVMWCLLNSVPLHLFALPLRMRSSPNSKYDFGYLRVTN